MAAITSTRLICPHMSHLICRRTVMVLLSISVIAPLIFLLERGRISTSGSGQTDFPEWSLSRGHADGTRRLSALEQVDNVFLKDDGNLLLRVNEDERLQDRFDFHQIVSAVEEEERPKEQPEIQQAVTEEFSNHQSSMGDRSIATLRDGSKLGASSQQNNQDFAESARNENKKLARIETYVIKREVDSQVLEKFHPKKREKSKAILDRNVRLMQQQLTMAKVYASLAQAHGNLELLQELKLQIKENQDTLGEAEIDDELPPSVFRKVKEMGSVLAKAQGQPYDCLDIVKKLRAMVHVTQDQTRMLKKQSLFLSQLAAKTVPQGLHCLSMRLTLEYYLLPAEEREFLHREKLEDPNLYHYALFTDNVLAASVVVNSTVFHAKEPEKHVFHLVTDKLNYGAMRMWFLANPPGNATIEVENVDDFHWLNSTYCPVLRQLESAAMKEYYFKANQPATSSSSASGLKYRNPKYLSMLNHLRFYLPQIYPKLDKLVFLDDDIVVQQDLTPLWRVDLHGKVNGAVETCGASFHRFDKYLNFSNPLIARKFDARACGWAYGMNVFDLKQWKVKDITGIYHRWQDLNEDRVLWKLGTLPPGLITFYNLTYALDKNWHVLGLGYNPAVRRRDIETAAVIHYNGNLKPWLEIAVQRFKGYWTKYVKYDHPFLQLCNIIND